MFKEWKHRVMLLKSFVGNTANTIMDKIISDHGLDMVSNMKPNFRNSNITDYNG